MAGWTRPATLRRRPEPDAEIALSSTSTIPETAGTLDGSSSPAPAAPTAGTVRLGRVTKRYGELVALDGVSLDVRAGEFLSILGPSGSGKTTTMRLIGGFEQPDEGTVQIAGVDVRGLPPYARDVNTVFQSYALFPHMTVQDNVAYGLRMSGVGKKERRRRADEMLELVQLRAASARHPGQLSGGMQQRVALARALVNRPSVLLLDEPLGALDRKLREDMQVELRRIQREVGITFVYVTHDQEEALSMSDRLVVMRAGGIEQLGTPSEVYDQPSSLWVADFVGTSSKLTGRVTAVTDEVRVESDLAPIVAGHRHGALAAGVRSTVIVRPEDIRLEPVAGLDLDGPASVNRVRVVVEELLNMGAQVKVVTRTVGGVELTARVARQDLRGIAPGDAVCLAFDASAAHAYPVALEPRD
jgi:ABC-type Fe3+/spermidine/putrescine transport system ATPase subunit